MKAQLTKTTKQYMGITAIKFIAAEEINSGTFVTVDIHDKDINAQFASLAKDKIDGDSCLVMKWPEKYWGDLKYGYLEGFGSDRLDPDKEKSVSDAFDEIIAACKGKSLAICYFN